MNNQDLIYVSTLSELEISKGRETRGYWQVGYDTTGASFNIPFIILDGSKGGPTLWIQGCIDGDEPSAAWAVVSLLQELNVEELNGRVILIPVLNVESFRA
ncbi:MAG: succinylglutamate desuccinylase/aspartoacylase family protein, partial [Anaerolineaceae bacterium]|nr:succinylglutamate desuccinylase/aspartoacylase family protein [Anaerolineaceae bacterium]